MSELAPGAILAGRYRIDRKLGEGGMGVVWAATHVVTRQGVALKLLQSEERDDPKFVQRFLREARAASAVRHPNVVTIHDVLELDDRTPMMVMELLDGESLGERLERERKLTIDEVARIVLPVVSAVGTAHALGIVHRDLKPDNIFLSMTPDGLVVKVLDFGIAKLSAIEGEAAATGNLTGTGALLGTPFYMAPEQIYGERDIDHRADIWALGVILYECLAGTRPTQGDNVGQILKVVTTGRIAPIDRLVAALPPEVTELVTRMLSLERDARPSMREVSGVLARFTDVAVRPFEDPVSRKPRNSAESSGQVIRVSDSARPHAPTVDTGGGARAMAETVDSKEIARPETLSSTTTQASAGAKNRSVIGLAAIGAAVLVAGSVGVRTWSVSRRPSLPPSATATVTAPETTREVPTTTRDPEPRVTADAPQPTHSASSSATVAVSAKRPPAVVPSAAATAATSTVASPTAKPGGATTTQGGVVEKPPF